MKTVTKIQNYIAEVKNCIIILKEKLSIVEDYAVRIQSILVKMIDISGFIVEYLRENGRMTDAEMIEVTENE